MIVDFDFDPKEDTEFPHEISPEDARKWDKHQGKFVNLLSQYEKKFGFTRSGMTSWAKFSATAFLDTQQIEKLAKDKRVNLLTENEFGEPSSLIYQSPWNNANVSFEFLSWGLTATTGGAGKFAASNARTVYVVDSGVAFHSDLPSVSSRVNMACGNNLSNCSTALANDPYPVVGCFPHATHIAGIIAAQRNNATGTQGVYSGANIVSVGINTATSVTAGKCADTTFTVAAIGYALDYIRYQTEIAAYWGVYTTPIVNLSLNSGRLGFEKQSSTQIVGETNRAPLLNLVTPGTVWIYYNGGWQQVNYPGAFMVQSAGNRADEGRDVCTQYSSGVTPSQSSGASLAYRPSINATSASTIDGIMVVGAIHSDAVPVTSATSRPFTASNPSGQANPLSSSNYGPCVDVWAPGNSIYSTWCSHSGPASGQPNIRQQCVLGTTYAATGTSGSSGWAFLSGTSMAAPYVAGAAAYLADVYGLTTPAAIEAKVRQHFRNTGQIDRPLAVVPTPQGQPVYVVQLP